MVTWQSLLVAWPGNANLPKYKEKNALIAKKQKLSNNAIECPSQGQERD